MRLLIVDESEPAGEIRHDGTQSGVYATLSLPEIIATRLIKTPARTEPHAPRPNELPSFADLKLENAPELMATLLNTIGLAYLTNGRLNEAECFVQEALELRLKLYGREHPQTAASINALARVLRDDGRLDTALTRINEALRIDTRISGADSLAAAADLAVLASIYFDKSELTQAEHAARSALAIFERKLDGADPWVPYLLDLLARIHRWRGAYDKAAELYHRVLEADNKVYGRDHPIAAVRRHNFASLLAARGERAKARALYDEIIAILSQASSAWHPHLIDIIGNRGSLLLALEDYAGARRDLEEAARLNRKVRGPDHPFIAYDVLNLGRLAYAEGDLEEALARFDEAYVLFRDRLSPKHAYAGAALTWKARTLVALGRAREAEAAARAALEVWGAELGERSIEHAIAHAVLARAWHLQEQHRDVVAGILTTALATVVSVRGADDPTARLIREWLDEATASRKH